MNKLTKARVLRDALEMQSAAARFFGQLAHKATDPKARKLLVDLARVEQLLTIEVDAMSGQLGQIPLSERIDPRVLRIKTAPEWEGFEAITVEQAMAVAFDCNRRAYRHHAEAASRFDGPVADFFLTLAQADLDRASMLERTLDRHLAEVAAQNTIEQVLVETLAAVRQAGKVYGRLAKRTERARTREFLKGMVEVCSLHAANIQRLVGESEEPTEDEPVFEGLIQATTPCLTGRVEDLDFESAMRMAMNAQKRAALLHGLQARAFPGEQAEMLLEIAEAERRHAATIASVLDRLAPDEEQGELEPASPLANAPRESWTCPAPDRDKLEQADAASPSLRLVAG